MLASEDIHLTRATNGHPTEPGYYHLIFERGIDPDVENPEICHDHSEIPTEWPAVEDILSFRAHVCKRITSLYTNGEAWSDRKVGRALWIGFEHEGEPGWNIILFLFFAIRDILTGIDRLTSGNIPIYAAAK